MNHLLLFKRGAVLAMLSSVTGCVDTALDGRQVAEQKGCIACHGTGGKAIAQSYPNLHGQWPRYLRLQLMAYRDGQRENAVMNSMAGSLTDDEIRTLAEFYGG